MNIHTDRTRLFGLVGFPLDHSFSKDFFNRKFEKEKIDAQYVNFEIRHIEELRAIIHNHPTLCGLNVTRPYKESIVSLLDAIDDEARAIGAVNVVKIFRQPDGSVSLKGYNSDCAGFADSIRPMLDIERHTAALVLGTGGAAKAVVHALRSMGIDTLSVARRQLPDCITYDDLTPDIVGRRRVIVNATPLGTHPHPDACPPIPYEAITAAHVCHDLVYNPATTLFMRRAAERGAAVKNGLEMLTIQALISWNIWNRRTHETP